MASKAKEVKEFEALLRELGFELIPNQDGFWVRQEGANGQVQVHRTPSCSHWRGNTVAAMFHAGMDVRGLKRRLRG